jgi:hypothetical protein
MSVLPPKADIGQPYAAYCDLIVCYGGAKLTDKHLASKIHCVGDKIIGWLERRELRKALIVADHFLETELDKLRASQK